MHKICMYPHPSSYNRGCEALAVSIAEILDSTGVETTKELWTKFPAESPRDDRKLLQEYYTFNQVDMPSVKRFSMPWFIYHLFGNFIKACTSTNLLSNEFYRIYKDVIHKNDIYLSIGGDNYCYGVPRSFYAVNKALNKAGKKTFLFGCSIEPSTVDDEMVEDLKNYTKVIARESITYEALVSKGLTNVVLYPDSAVTLSVQEPEDDTFKDGKAITAGTIGLNVSPLILGYASNSEILFDSYIKLIDYILNETDYSISLIPHVSSITTNDREVHKKLKEHFADNNRIIYIDDHNCKQQKYLISKCKMFIGARTHSTIAAYSTCVPTLVTGYSVKAKGIAKDIFGTDENYVVPVQSIDNDNMLIDAFKWLMANENSMRKHLEETMPDYIKKARQASDVIIKEL